ncbi:hypothetical protein BV22DRAFT_1037715 [Leucogyrophana mollusca]|uniref:Uncharacterized protein n=1 Tax=Leucogyrophana mollusca TaxID=85980 RepID=A0ACB8B8W6_9AGAM|nr:hypothetical protein BV22DRAFT_1037715 [Leucogyrophana mollusca]
MDTYPSGSEASDVEYDELDSSQGHGKGRDNTGGYRLTNVLKLPRATTYTALALYEQVISSDIDLEPEYQRDVVWPESKQIGLIDSIFRNFYVPPIIFVSHQLEDGSETKTCIDGKQRLTSIQRFMDGLIPHKDPFSNDKYWYKLSSVSQTSRGPGKLLHDKYRRLFANKQIVCIEYQDLPDGDEREIFQRVQLGMALTPAEKLQVLATPMAAFVRTLQAEYLSQEKPLGGETLDWDRSRGADFRCVAQALYVIAKYPSQLSVGTMPQVEKWLHTPTVKARGKGKKKAAEDEEEDDLSNNEAFLERIHDTFRILSGLVGEPSLSSLFLRPGWRVSPIEFITMCLLVSVHKNKLTRRQLAEQIGEMRKRVRAEHVDIRMNGRVAKTLIEFIKEIAGPAALPARELSANALKRHREAEGAEQSRKLKEKKGDSPPLPSLSRKKPSSSSMVIDDPPPSTTPVRSLVSTPHSAANHLSGSQVSIPAPLPPRPAPDRLAAVRAAKESISASSLASRMGVPVPRAPPSAPSALRDPYPSFGN